MGFMDLYRYSNSQSEYFFDNPYLNSSKNGGKKREKKTHVLANVLKRGDVLEEILVRVLLANRCEERDTSTDEL